MKRVYDNLNKRLIYFGESPTPNFWDSLWSMEKKEKKIVYGNDQIRIAKIFAQYKGKKAKVLEAGCGNASYLMAFRNFGLNVVGVDFAKKTVSFLQNNYPELDVRLGDVRSLEFEDQSFDCYYSGGLIEHFWGGYNEILSESFRVLRPGGIAIFSFPAMSKLRKAKALINRYDSFDVQLDFEPENFYQFALCPKQVEESFKQIGYLPVTSIWRAGAKGLSDEILIVNKILKKYPSLLAKIIGKIGTLGSFFWGHSIVVVLLKPDV